jgi:competence protein ComEC
LGAWRAAAFAGGAWWLQQQAELPGAGPLFMAAALAMLAHTWERTAPGPLRHAAPGAALAAWALAGFGWAALHAHHRLADGLDPSLEGRDLVVVGVVSGLPERSARGWRFRFHVDAVADGSAGVPRQVVLAWFDPDEAGVDTAAAPVRPAERWRFTVRLHRPHGTANPHAFDGERQAFARGDRAAGYVRPGARERLDVLTWRPGPLVERVRAVLRTRMQQAAAGLSHGGVLVALALGDQAAIPASQWKVFTRTGVNHLMSISGLHVTMLAGLAAAAAGWGWRRLPGRRGRITAPDTALAAGLVVALGYALLAGFEVPARRTVLMLAVMAWSRWLRLGAGPVAVLGGALVAVVAADPMAVVAAGFWLSFGAVATMMAAVEAATGRWGWLIGWGRVQWVLFVALAPPLAVLFQQVSLVAPLANAVAVPVVSFVVVPLALLLAAVPVAPVAWLAHLPMALLATVLEWLAALPGSVWTQHAPSAWSVALALAGTAWLLAPRGFPARASAMALFAPMLMLAPPPPGPGEAEVTVLDVGQGLAVVIRTASSAVVFDAGPAWAAETDSGSRIVAPFLRGEGVRRVDALVLSHDDLDHTGGAAGLLAAIPVTAVLASLPPGRAPPRGLGRVTRCVAGTSWGADGVRFDILHPQAPFGLQRSLRDNDRSCVLRVVSAFGRVLLTADVEKAAEAAMLASGEALAAEVLVVPHHGSATSSSPAFVAAVKPRVAIVSAGWRNRFGHPKPEVVARYHAAGSRLLRTDESGAITVRLRAGGPAVSRWRDLHRRYWQGR